MGRRDTGFTLIEVLVALAIATLLIAALYRGLGIGWRAIAVADREAAAVAIARAQLASVGVETPLVAGTRSGDAAGGFTWTETVLAYAPSADENGGDDEVLHPALYRVMIEVRWTEPAGRGTRTYRLVTIKSGDAP